MVKRLYKSKKNAVIDGVCSGIAEYFEVDPVLVRLIFLFSLFFGGIGFLIYIIAMFIIPEKPRARKGQVSVEKEETKKEKIEDEEDKSFKEMYEEQNDETEDTAKEEKSPEEKAEEDDDIFDDNDDFFSQTKKKMITNEKGKVLLSGILIAIGVIMIISMFGPGFIGGLFKFFFSMGLIGIGGIILYKFLRKKRR